jgi:hypothetical protein
VQEAAAYAVSMCMGDEQQQGTPAARSLAREVNTQIERVAMRFESPEGEFLCECGSADCDARLRMPLDEYERIRTEAGRYFVAPGHEARADDPVIERHDAYVVAQAALA